VYLISSLSTAYKFCYSISTQRWGVKVFLNHTGYENLHKISNDNGVRQVNFAISKILDIKNTMFSYHKIHKINSDFS
jgi:hypothetical protein